MQHNERNNKQNRKPKKETWLERHMHKNAVRWKRNIDRKIQGRRTYSLKATETTRRQARSAVETQIKQSMERKVKVNWSSVKKPKGSRTEIRMEIGFLKANKKHAT